MKQYDCNRKERQLAENIMRALGKTLVENLGGGTCGGDSLMDAYCHMYSNGYDIVQIANQGLALRHWVEAAGYDDNGDFTFILSNHFLD